MAPNKNISIGTKKTLGRGCVVKLGEVVMVRSGNVTIFGVSLVSSPFTIGRTAVV